MAGFFLVAESALVVLLKQIAPSEAFGVLYLLGVLMVSTVWGIGLAVTTSVASAVAFDYFRNWPSDFTPTGAQNWVAIAVFLVVALSANTLAGVARSRAHEADQRRREADLAAELARIMLRSGDSRSAMDETGRRLAEVIGLPFAAIELEVVSSDQRRSAILLNDAGEQLGTLLVPAALPESIQQRLRERVAPSLETLLRAVRDREAINDALESSRRELERFFDLSSDLLCIVGPDGYYKRLNPAFERVLGYPIQALLSRPILDFVHPEDRSRVGALLDELSDGHVPSQFEARFIACDGSERWLECNAVPDRSLVYGAARDVTERRKAQRMIEASRQQLTTLAEQQAALRRVATLVAQGATSSEVFSAVAEESAGVLGVNNTALHHYEADDTATFLAAHTPPGTRMPPIGTRHSIEGENIEAMVLRTGHPARIDNHDNAPGSVAAYVRALGIRSAVGAPIIVEGHLWGALIAGTSRSEPLPPNTEVRLAEFGDLVATAIANAQTRAQLTASRARIVAAADEARRRLERDLHDGAQQRLVSLGLELRTAEASVPSGQTVLKAQISHTVEGLVGVSSDLQEISRGIHPAILSKGGLGPALKALARRSAVPVDLDLNIAPHVPESTEVATYYVAAEALTNAAKHAQASVVTMRARTEGVNLELLIRDDGVGGADPTKGSGLIGLTDRVEALGGQMKIASRAGTGTSLLVTLPFAAE